MAEKRELMGIHDFVKEVAARSGHSQKTVSEVIKKMHEVTIDELPHRNIRIMEGVILATEYRTAFKRKHPTTGEMLTIPGAYIPKCRFGKSLRDVTASMPV